MMNDKEVIQKFVKFLSEDHPGLTVNEWPDQVDSTIEEIDAIAGPFAIEHTSIDTLPNQRRDSNWFIQAVGKIENELAGKIPYYLKIIIPYNAIRRGQTWEVIHISLIKWITTKSSQLSDGHHVIQNAQDVPFNLSIWKSSETNRKQGVYFGRTMPDDDTFSNRLQKQINKKARKLLKYQSLNKTTVLLLQRSDSLMDEDNVTNAIKEAFPNHPPTGVNEIWYADGFMRNDIEFMNLTRCLPCYLHQPDCKGKCLYCPRFSKPPVRGSVG